MSTTLTAPERPLTYELIVAALGGERSGNIRLAAATTDPVLVGTTDEGTPVLRARPVLVDGAPDLRVCHAPGCSASLEGQRRHARYHSDACRQVAAKRRRRARAAREAHRARIDAILSDYIEQTVKRSVRGVEDMPRELLAIALRRVDLTEATDVELDALAGILLASPDRAHHEDAGHRLTRVDPRVDLAAVQALVEADPDVLWCVWNDAAGVSWRGARGSLGNVRRPLQPETVPKPHRDGNEPTEDER